MNSLAENILYIYLIVFVSMLVFDVLSILYRNFSNANIKRLTAHIHDEILSIDLKKIDDYYLRVLSKQLKNAGYFIAFTSAVDSLDEKIQTEYLSKVKSTFVKVLPHYEKEEAIRQTYFIHFIAEHPCLFDEKTNKLVSYIIKCTLESSVYLRENALNALYSLGKVQYIKEAFYQMNYLNIRHHHKLITDGLLRFRGNTEELCDMLIEELKYYDDDYKVACINYFGYRKIDCKEFIYKILTASLEYKEVRIACIRYFSNVQYEPVIDVLYDLLEDDRNNWEYSAIAATTLKRYPSKETIERLKGAIRSHNWYVRNNAAASLIDMTDETKRHRLIKSIEDKYAKEALDYQLHLLGGEG